MIYQGGELGTPDTIIPLKFNEKDFSPIGRMHWDKQYKEWIFDDSEVFARLFYASAVLHRSLYFHPGVQGPEHMIKEGIERLGIKNFVREAALTYNDVGLERFLAQWGLDYWLSPKGHEGWVWANEVIPANGTYKHYVPKFNLRTETLVQHEGKILPFSQARPDVTGFVYEMVGEYSGQYKTLIDTLWSQRPTFSDKTTFNH